MTSLFFFLLLCIITASATSAGTGTPYLYTDLLAMSDFGATLARSRGLPLICAALSSKIAVNVSSVSAAFKNNLGGLEEALGSGVLIDEKKPFARATAARPVFEAVLGAAAKSANVAAAIARELTTVLKPLADATSVTVPFLRRALPTVGIEVARSIKNISNALALCARSTRNTVRSVRHGVLAVPLLLNDATICEPLLSTFERSLRQSADFGTSGAVASSTSLAFERTACATGANIARTTASSFTALGEVLTSLAAAIEKAVKGAEKITLGAGAAALESLDHHFAAEFLGGNVEEEPIVDSAIRKAALDAAGNDLLEDARRCEIAMGLGGGLLDTLPLAINTAVAVTARDAPRLFARVAKLSGSLTGAFSSTCSTARDRDVGNEVSKASGGLDLRARRLIDVSRRAILRIINVALIEGSPDSSEPGPALPRLARVIGPIAQALTSFTTTGATGVESDKEVINIEKLRNELITITQKDVIAATHDDESMPPLRTPSRVNVPKTIKNPVSTPTLTPTPSLEAVVVQKQEILLETTTSSTLPIVTPTPLSETLLPIATLTPPPPIPEVVVLEEEEEVVIAIEAAVAVETVEQIVVDDMMIAPMAVETTEQIVVVEQNADDVIAPSSIAAAATESISPIDNDDIDSIRPIVDVIEEKEEEVAASDDAVRDEQTSDVVDEDIDDTANLIATALREAAEEAALEEAAAAAANAALPQFDL
jgi:hypothetical protein